MCVEEKVISKMIFKPKCEMFYIVDGSGWYLESLPSMGHCIFIEDKEDAQMFTSSEADAIIRSQTYSDGNIILNKVKV